MAKKNKSDDLTRLCLICDCPCANKHNICDECEGEATADYNTNDDFDSEF